MSPGVCSAASSRCPTTIHPRACSQSNADETSVKASGRFAVQLAQNDLEPRELAERLRATDLPNGHANENAAPSAGGAVVSEVRGAVSGT